MDTILPAFTASIHSTAMSIQNPNLLHSFARASLRAMNTGWEWTKRTLGGWNWQSGKVRLVASLTFCRNAFRSLVGVVTSRVARIRDSIRLID